jgi:hypothetical protein
MNIEELKSANTEVIHAFLQEQRELVNGHPYNSLIGKNIIVRTVTMIYTGKLAAVYPNELVLTEVSWIPETERYAQFVANGDVRECEPYPADLGVIIGRGGLMDIVELRANLPRTQK